MKMSVISRLDLFARNLTPFALSIVLVILSVVPLQIPNLAAVTPALALIAVYHWAIHRPDLLPIFAVFLIGLLLELLSRTHFGINILILLLVYLAVAPQRRFLLGKPFFVSWIGFVIVGALAALLSFVLASFLSSQFVRPQPILFQYALTIVLYPCVAWIFGVIQRTFIRAVD